jgi:hypothetical protein
MVRTKRRTHGTERGSTTQPGRMTELQPKSAEAAQPSQAQGVGEDPDASLFGIVGAGSRLDGGHAYGRRWTSVDSGCLRPAAMPIWQVAHSLDNSGYPGRKAGKGRPAAGIAGKGRNDTLSHAPGLGRDEGLDSSRRTGHAQRVTTVHPALTTRPGIRQD